MAISIPPVTVPAIPSNAVPSGKIIASTNTGVTPQASSADTSAYAVALSAQAQPQIAIAQEAASFKNDYAVSDKEFTIFKDATGKFITRYVSLRDGSITYEPSAPAVVKNPAAITPNVAISV